MGNSSSREARAADLAAHHGRHREAAGASAGPASPGEGGPSSGPVRPSARTPRGDLSFLNLGNTTNVSAVPERRETKQEREARRLEKEKIAREKERERSIKEEHVDGGYLVTMGVYTGTEDFSKPVVRQMMIERRIAPFWRGLDDFNEEWAEHQLVAAGRGLPVPAADEIPDDLLMPTLEPPEPISPHVQSLMVPITARSPSAASDSSLHPFSLPSPTSPMNLTVPSPSSSPFRPRSKTLASLTSPTRSPQSAEMVPREIQLPKDPFVNGQALEVFLYKDSTECPICFIYYPPYLNMTRCCDQPICSECFVQIKRPDPHPPEHEHADANNPVSPTSPDNSNPATPAPEPAEEPESLVSEPACCPYCQQSEFGVTYEPPPFRRGLAYANSPSVLGTFSPAMSSTSSLNSMGSPTHNTHTHKRRNRSISANASNVITTDRVRPDWSTKLANARAHLARRSAAATALHTAAYLMGNGTTDNRAFGFSGRSRFGRSRGDSSPAAASGSATPMSPSNSAASRAMAEHIGQMRREGRVSGSGRNRMEDLEDMMMMEAIRLSLAAEEERKRKAEKDAARDAKKKAKEDKKKDKKDKKGVYSGASSTNGSSLSLSLPHIGRRRGNSGASSLAREVTQEELSTTAKGKSVDRDPSSTTPSPPLDGSSSQAAGIPTARQLDPQPLASVSDQHGPLPSPSVPGQPSHLRQMSTASSPASSFIESAHGSLRNGHGSSSTLESPNESGTNVNHMDETPEGEDANGNAGLEPMFNFQSLTAMIGLENEKERIANHVEDNESENHNGEGSSAAIVPRDQEPPEEASSSTTDMEQSVATIRVVDDDLSDPIDNDPFSDNNAIATPDPQATPFFQSQGSTPSLMVTPVTPAPLTPDDEASKQLGTGLQEGRQQITQ